MKEEMDGEELLATYSGKCDTKEPMHPQRVISLRFSPKFSQIQYYSQPKQLNLFP